MSHLLYLALLLACVLGTAPLELLLGAQVYRRWLRLLAALTPPFLLGILWDAYAVHSGQWRFDARYLTGVYLGSLPLEEVLFFIVIPGCAVLTLEAVRRQCPGWLIGDEVAEGIRTGNDGDQEVPGAAGSGPETHESGAG